MDDPTESYRSLIVAFTEQRLTAAEFETLYLALYKSDETDWPAAEFDVLDTLFAAVDDFCDDDDLRDEVGGLDEDGLRDAAAAALADLKAMHAPK